jgi:hypothetical protein
MGIIVKHPNGSTVEFPDGTDGATIQNAMRQLDGAAPKTAPEPMQQPQQTQPPQDGTGLDVAKSLGIGAVQGAMSLGMWPGNVETLGRAGINKVSEKMGYGQAVSPENVLPNYNDFKAVSEEKFGQFYQPKTVPGEYARTIGEFAPAAAFGPGGVIARTSNVAVPAFISETAGQMTKGSDMEPWARAGGAFAGGLGTALATRAVTPAPATAQHLAAVNRLEQEGVTSLTAGQRTGSKPMRWAESVAGDTPFNGGRAGRLMEQQGEQFTAAALRRAGVDANRATPEVIDGAFNALGQQFDDIARNTFVVVDDQMINDIRNVLGTYEGLVSPVQQAPVVRGIVNDLLHQLRERPNFQIGTDGIAGDFVQAFRSRVSRLAAQRHQDPQLAQALAGIRDAFDDAVARSNPQIAEQWQGLRQQYANLLRVSDAMAGAGEATAQGLVSPAQLRTAAKTANKRNYVRGRSDIGNLARDGEAVMKPLPNSGTPARQGVQGVMNVGAALLGNTAAGLPGAAAAMITPGMLSRGLMSAPMQRYLSNQVATPLINALEQGRIPALAYTPQASTLALPGAQQK